LGHARSSELLTWNLVARADPTYPPKHSNHFK
jgi:hypothetical protein